MTRWLNQEQQKHWRAWISTSILLSDRLSHELSDSNELTFNDYEILVRLSESDGRAMRMSELANLTLLSRSRLSHQIDRMSKAGLVERVVCDTDRRGQIAKLTDLGWEKLVKAAPDHVESVRKHFVDILTDDEFAALGLALRKIADHLESFDDK
jgi:DNA-binding MarR family transcriptional regulator